MADRRSGGELSTAQIEERLRDPSLPREEREALVEALSTRLAGEMVQQHDRPSEAPPRPGPRPEDLATPRPTTGPPPGQTSGPPPGPGPAPASRPRPAPPVAAPRRRSGSGLRGLLAGLVALVVVAGGAGAAVKLLGSASGDDGPTPGPSPVVDTTPTVDDSSGSAASGPVGSTSISWLFHGVAYDADVTTDGSSGHADVTFVDPDTDETVTVREDLTFVKDGDDFWLMGSDPRDPVTEEAVDYYPDQFHMVHNSGGWTFTEICDTSGCTPIT